MGVVLSAGVLSLPWLTCSDPVQPQLPDQRPLPGQQTGQADLDRLLEPAQHRLPPEHLAAIAVASARSRPVPSLQRVRQRLLNDPVLRPLREALARAGLTDEQAALHVYAAAGHNAGVGHDPVAARARQLARAFGDARQRFGRQLSDYEHRTGKTIDRAALARRLASHRGDVR